MLENYSRQFSEIKPDVLQHLGNNNYYYNYDIKEDSKIQNDLESGEDKEIKGYSFIQVYIKGTPDFNKCYNGIIRQYITELGELTLINNYNAHINSIKINNEIVQQYIDYINLCSVISKNVSKDLNIQVNTTLETIKQEKLNELSTYDKSENVNSFTLNGDILWLDKDTRVGLMNSTNIQKEAGQKTTTLWFEGKSYTLPCDTAIQMLSALELYALSCYNVTAQHKANVEALTTKEEVEAYDYTTGYPDKLNLTTT